MTKQVEDCLIWKSRKYKFIGADNLYQLFNPEKFGFIPESVETACWKGFVMYFIVNAKDELILDRLDINDSNNNYPQINGVKSYRDRNGYHIYKNINLPLSSYSGKIIIVDDVENIHLDLDKVFMEPYFYDGVYELQIKKGKVIWYKEIYEDFK